MDENGTNAPFAAMGALPFDGKGVHGGRERSDIGSERSRVSAAEVAGVESTVWPLTGVLPETTRSVGALFGDRRALA